jgi:hypothetical protein
MMKRPELHGLADTLRHCLSYPRCKGDPEALIKYSTNFFTFRPFKLYFRGLKLLHCLSWCELPGCELVYTGGYTFVNGFGEAADNSRNFIKVSLRRDLSYCYLANLLEARYSHSSIYLRGHVYVIGGKKNRHVYLSSCKRFSFESSQWESIAPLPIAVSYLSLLEQEFSGSLFAFGGTPEDPVHSDLIHKLDLERLTWAALPLKLPVDIHPSPCFKLNAVANEVYFVQEEHKLYLMKPHELSVEFVRDLSVAVTCVGGQCYYRGDVLYTIGEGVWTLLGKLHLPEACLVSTASS